MNTLETLATLETQNVLKSALNDLKETFRRFPVSIFLAFEDIRDRFNRMALGILWLPISFILFVLVKVVIFSQLNNTSMSWFFVYTALGLWVWTFIVALIIDGCNAFIRSAPYIKAIDLPYGIYCIRVVIRSAVPYVLSLGFILLSIPVFRESFHLPGLIWILPVSLIYFINGFWVSLFLGTISAIYRDITQIVQTLIRMMFFLTPVLWVPEQLGEIGKNVALYNPLAHFIAIVRDPIMYGTVPVLSWIIVLTITFIGLLSGVLIFGHGRPRVYHFV